MQTTQKIKIKSVELDSSIQCRATINTGTVNEYAERMIEGDVFPSIVVFGTPDRCWIGDGWHRVLAGKQIDLREIDAEVRPGGRVDALKYALKANATNGLRRTNEDKRRCVEIALKEFPNLSDVAIAELCGVNDKTVAAHRPVNLGNSDVEKRIGRDGKERPAQRTKTEQPIIEPATEFEKVTGWPEEVYSGPMGKLKEDEKSKKRCHGTFADYKRLRELVNGIKEMAKEMSTLHVDVQRKLTARVLCEELAQTFTKLALKMLE